MANEKIVNRENLKAFRKAYDERLKQGKISVSKALTAKEIENVSSESGDTQETPYILQGTGTANGTGSVDTGTVGKHIQKQGSVYCENQLFNTSGSTETRNGITFTNNGDGSWTLSGIATADTYKFLGTFSLAGRTIRVGFSNIVNAISGVSINEGNIGWSVGTIQIRNVSSSTTSSNLGIYVANGTNLSTPVKVIPQLNDLTQWFNGNIPQDIIDNPSHFSHYHNYGDYIPYNTGTLVASNGRYLVNTGRNQWDEEWGLGRYYTDTGLPAPSTTQIINKNLIKVIGGQTYYFKLPSGKTYQDISIFFYDVNGNYLGYDNPNSSNLITLPNNCSYINFTIIQSTYNHDITISLYYAGEDYSKYYPYEQPKVYDTGTEILLSTGVKLSVSGEREDVYDYKEPDGTIVRRVGTRAYQSGDENDSTLFTDGTTTYYPLASEDIYTEQGTPFSENIEINDFGTMGWYSSYTDSNTNELVDVPQGCKIFYPAWYVGFIDSLGQRADIDWDAGNIVSQTQLGAIDTKIGVQWSQNLTLVPTGGSNSLYGGNNKIYIKNNRLYVEINWQFVLGNTLTLGVNNVDVTIPSEYGDKIIDISGRKLSQSVGNNGFITMFVGYLTGQKSFINVMIAHTAQNTLTINLSSISYQNTSGSTGYPTFSVNGSFVLN